MTSKRILYLDVLNIIAIISVIALHCNGIVHKYHTENSWAQSLVVETVFFFAVPLFLMISGANLLGYISKYDTQTFFKKRFAKVLYPAIFWICIAFIWRIFILKAISLENVGIVEFINMVFINKEMPIYYFIWWILGLYLTIPILTHLTTDAKYQSVLWYAVGIFFIFNALIPNLLKLVGINWNNSFSLQMGGVVIYAILGYLLAVSNISKKLRYIIYALAIFAIIYRYSFTYFQSKEAGKVITITWGYFQFHVFFLTSAIFLFVKNMNLEKLQNNARITKILANIANCSFGVYLCHMIIVHYELSIFGIDEYSLQWRTIGIITTYIISLALVYLLKQIPFIRRVVA
ncbi:MULTISPECIES: acyltransferase [unclassified Campylobacter]|uniref:acyltransferase n=1 Tax=unclassified Campylobacter TaxID=2593542 RepID=UPI0022E9A412|nr:MULTISPECIES: acyltransferase family protein [unclassified Campylobacter]MDA3062020.1 acyltransferase family protein [Campylobacter sp. JMF_14 EL1]MDA3072875.1 acyltransferase family protein [Campylobacter sp. JMF_10 EL2]